MKYVIAVLAILPLGPGSAQAQPKAPLGLKQQICDIMRLPDTKFGFHMEASDLAARVRGRTMRYGPTEHGSYYFYVDNALNIYLWRIGEAQVIRAQLDVEQVAPEMMQPDLARDCGMRTTTHICYRQGGSFVETGGNASPNPFSRGAGREPKPGCILASSWVAYTANKASGDVFGLSRSTVVPMILPVGQNTIQQMQQILKARK